MFYSAFLCATFTKLLFIPAYKSTDFEVHRNWLAITSTLPVSKWYYDEGSIWTLDYPPFFAWFQYILSFFAYLFDKEMLNINNLNYDSSETILFQRLSVIFTDIVYAYGTYRCWKAIPSSTNILPIALLTSVGLFIVDHIHFQYNGVMFGVLLISISHLLKGNNLWAAFWFAFLLNMKHIFMYIAPAYFVYLLRNHCLAPSKSMFRYNVLWKRLATLASLVIAVFAASFGPFYDQLPQILSRLFPFKRGLCHAYWAPNFWAFYNTLDAGLTRTISIENNMSTSTASCGLIGDTNHMILPNITPLVTLVITAVVAIPLLLKLWMLGSTPLNCVRGIVLCALTAFLFGWHVHEKAILMAILPMSILACTASKDAKFFIILSAAGHYSLFPLLFTPDLLIIKLLLFITYTLYTIYGIGSVYKTKTPLLNRIELLYLIGFAGLFAYNNLIHKLLGLDTRLPFLTLWITSLYCFVGICYSYLRYYCYFMNIQSKAGLTRD